ncbi:hypothetical protein B0H11DRAFT_1755817, partial [Mycena galericulata]
LGYRRQGYKPDQLDYRAYVNILQRFLRSRRGRIALRVGGIVGRLARDVVSSDDVCLGPSDDVEEHGVWVQDKGTHSAYWDEQLTGDEIDLICGVYHVATGQRDPGSAKNRQTTAISWWPRPMAFYGSGINAGWWSPACEHFYQRRLAQIIQGDASLLSQNDWKNNLKMEKKCVQYFDGIERCAARILQILRP